MAIDAAHAEQWREILAEEPGAHDLADLRGYAEEEMPWRFDSLVHSLAQMSHHLLEIGAGAGEALAALADVLPADTVVTEASTDLVPTTRSRLDPLGVEVIEHDPRAAGATLPFAPERFDLVVARHAPFDAHEVRRILTPGGTLLTEQVGSDDLGEILHDLEVEHVRTEGSLQDVERELTDAGLRIERSDAYRGRAVFTDMPSLLRVLRRIPGVTAEDLDPGTRGEQLEKLSRRLEDGPLTTVASRFWLQARAPEAVTPSVTDFSQLLGGTPEVPKV